MKLWNSKRVFFATPQVIQNDISDPAFPVKSIKLICVDEAHKAKGNYAYCEVIKQINAVHQQFRVLALSATPGRPDETIELIRNLLIAKIEVRTENSIDVHRYTFTKQIVVEKVQLGELAEIRDRYMSICDPYLRQLLDHKVISGSYLNKGWIIIQQKKFLAQNHPQKSEISKLFSISISLLYSLEVLERHGVQIFLNSFKDDSNVTNLKYFVGQDKSLKALVWELSEKFKDSSPLLLNVNPLPTGEIPSIADKNLIFGHPKFDILKTKLVEYFSGGGTKTIIFCEFRDTVLLVYTLLLQLRPTVLPRMLIGQGGSVSQKDQLAVMKDFRSNKVNALVTTSVCEEGIDVGDVDLVICFDINSKNSTRFVQRIGRTGRKRNGKVLILATEGMEEEVVRDVIGKKDKLNKSIHSNKEIQRNLYTNAPRLVPAKFRPQCVETKFHIAVVEAEAKPKGKAKNPVKAKKIPTKSIATHFKPLRRQSQSLDEVMEAIPDAPQPVQVIIRPSLDRQFVEIKSEFKELLGSILEKIADYPNMTEFFKLRSVEDLEMMDKVTALLQDQTIDDGSVHSQLNCEYLLDDSFEVTSRPIPLAMPKEAKKEFLESQAEQFLYVESRYGHQPSTPEPFRTPIKSTTLQLSTSAKRSASSPAGPSGIAQAKKLRKSPIENSPLMRAFERQKNLQTSTPIATRTTPATASKPSTSRCESGKQKTALEYFGIDSISDIFEGSDFNLNSSTEKPPEVPSPQNSSVAKLLELPDTISMQDEVIESSVVEDAPAPPVKKKKIVIENENEFDVMKLFDCSSDLNRNIEDPPSDFSQQTQVYSFEDADKENAKSLESPSGMEQVLVVNSVVVEVPSPQKSPKAVRPRPNFAKLMNALKSPNFLSSKVEQEPQSPHLIKPTIKAKETLVDLTVETFRPPTAITPKITKFLLPTPSTSFHAQSPISSRARKVKNFNSVAIRDEDEPAQSPRVTRKKKTSRKRKRNDFFDTQAGVDGTDSSDEDDEDETLDGFIANNTIFLTQHDEEDRVDMQAKYLESLKSPFRGNFKIPQLPPPQSISMIYSQAPPEEDDWEMDSFIVDNTEDHSMDSEIDELEVAENILRSKRRKARKQKNGKRRKVVRSVESSDEENELEELRKRLNSNPD